MRPGIQNKHVKSRLIQKSLFIPECSATARGGRKKARIISIIVATPILTSYCVELITEREKN